MNLNELYTNDDSIIVNNTWYWLWKFFYKVTTKKFLTSGQEDLLFQIKKYTSSK